MHERNGFVGEAVPAGLLGHVDGGPALDFGEEEDDRAGLFVDFVAFLALDVFVPRGGVAGNDRCGERLHIYFAEGAEGDADVHGGRL